ncbi:MAG: Ig-like domain-containing protein [Patescibacteria group bacterium]
MHYRFWFASLPAKVVGKVRQMLGPLTKRAILSLAIVASSGGLLVGAYFIEHGIDPVDWIRGNPGSGLQSVNLAPIVATGSEADAVLPAATTGSVAGEETPPPSQDKPKPEAKKQIAKSPPKQETSSNKIAGEVVRNENGTVTTVVSEGNVSQGEYNRVADITSSQTDPYGVKFSDETGRYPDLEQLLKDYLNNTLKWSGEISALKEITVRDAGDTGWSGLYNGSYTMTSTGDITSAFGWITLNSSYYKDSTYFDDYMKAVLAHEYGHHYTLYHKWVDADLAAGTRFPDSYYNVRPLSKDATTVDCSTGWETCEPEIIAEDYAYFYSGYDYHAMQSTVGLPSSPGTKSWLDNIVDSLQSDTEPSAPVQPSNSPPSVKITSPTNGGTLGEQFDFVVAASDDRGVSKVVFYRDDTVLLEDIADPYEVAVDLSGLVSGTYVFKAKAIDTDGVSSEKSFSLNIVQTGQPSNSSASSGGVSQIADSSGGTSTSVADTTSPSVSFSKPSENPYNWASGNLLIKAEGSDNVAVVKVEIYINDSLVAEESADAILRRWDYSNVGPGSYTLKAKAYDAAGNVGEALLTVEKQ